MPISAAQLRSVRTQKVRDRDLERWADRAIAHGKIELAIERATDVAQCVRQKLEYHERLRDDPAFLDQQIARLRSRLSHWQAVAITWQERKTGYDAPAFEEQAI